MAIRIKKEDREEVRRLLQLAVQLQVRLYDLLGEIEKITGRLNGLDDFVREDASNYTDVDFVKIDDDTLKAMLSNVEREK